MALRAVAIVVAVFALSAALAGIVTGLQGWDITDYDNQNCDIAEHVLPDDTGVQPATTETLRVSSASGDGVMAILTITVAAGLADELVGSTGKPATDQQIQAWTVPFTGLDETVPFGDLVLSAREAGHAEDRSFSLHIPLERWNARAYPLDTYHFGFDWTIPIPRELSVTSASTPVGLPVTLELRCNDDQNSLYLQGSSTSTTDLALYIRRDGQAILFVSAVLLLLLVVAVVFAWRISHSPSSTTSDVITVALATLAIVSIRSVFVPAEIGLPTVADLILLSSMAVTLIGVSFQDEEDRE